MLKCKFKVNISYQIKMSSISVSSQNCMQKELKGRKKSKNKNKLNNV